MSYQQCTRFQTTVDFDHEYLEQIRQSTSGKRRYQLRFFPRTMKPPRWTLVVYWRKNDLDLWPMTLKFNRVRGIVRLSMYVPAKFHQEECSGSWVIILTEKKSDKNNTVRLRHADSSNENSHAYVSRVLADSAPAAAAAAAARRDSVVLGSDWSGVAANIFPPNGISRSTSDGLMWSVSDTHFL